MERGLQADAPLLCAFPTDTGTECGVSREIAGRVLLVSLEATQSFSQTFPIACRVRTHLRLIQMGKISTVHLSHIHLSQDFLKTFSPDVFRLFCLRSSYRSGEPTGPLGGRSQRVLGAAWKACSDRVGNAKVPASNKHRLLV